MRPSQLSFLSRMRLDHGGSTGMGRRKVARPFNPKRPLHIVLRSTQARGERSLLKPRHRHMVQITLEKCKRKYGVRVYRFANVGNHLHLLIQVRKRIHLQGFLRELAGSIAFQMTGATKGKPARVKFWDRLAYSRMVSWGREFATQKLYVTKNFLEGSGLSRLELARLPNTTLELLRHLVSTPP